MGMMVVKVFSLPRNSENIFSYYCYTPVFIISFNGSTFLVIISSTNILLIPQARRPDLK